jgi:acetyl-CoA synthetase
MHPFIWRPEDHAWTRDSHVARFMSRHGFATFNELHAASVRDTAWFWDAAMQDMGVEWFQPYAQVKDESRGFPWTKWFLGGEVNLTHNCIDRHVRDGHGDEVALYCEADSGKPESRQAFTFVQLSRTIDACARKLRELGVGPGDSVALYAPMCVQTVEILFAACKLGARFVPIFCGYGETALMERLASCEAKVLFGVEHLHRRGKAIPTGGIVRAAAARVPSIRSVIMFDTPQWPEFVYSGGYGTPLECVHTAAEDTALLIYTSGTTGRPKGTVHTHAGCLAQMGKELRYAFNVQAGEPFFWFTDIGWMMGPWEIIGCLLYRTPIVLFDGAPDYPDSDRLWETCARLGVVTFACSPTLIRLLMRATEGKGPAGYDLAKLRVLGSTGEVWDEASYLWYFEQVGRRRCPVINISGGTEIVGSHLSPTPLTPLKACSLGGPSLGMDVAAYTDEGQPAPRGMMGHLVCRQPAPSMTKSFLHDDARYLETYFQKFPGVWYHGDWAKVDEDGQWFLFGRTDDTMKVAGKRVGPGEVESALTAHPAVSEAAVIGVPDDLKGTALVCFVVLKPGVPVPMERELIGQVAGQLGKPLAPKHVFVLPALPKTRSGKIVRAAITRVFLGQPPGDITSIDNPVAFEAIAALGKTPAGTG